MRKALLSVVGTNVLAKLLSVLTFIVIIRVLSKEEYARYTNAQAVYAMLSGFVFSALNFGMVRAAAQARARNPERPWREFASYGLLQLICYGPLLGVGVGLAAPLAGLFFGDVGKADELLWGVVAVSGLLSSNYVLYVIQSEEEYGRYNRQNLVRHLLLLPLMGLAVVLDQRTWLATLGVFFLANFLPAVWYLLHPRNRRLATLSDADRGVMKEAVNGTFWLMLYFAGCSVVDHLGVFFVNRAHDSSVLADYGAALRYYQVELLILFSINAVLLPRFARADESAGSHRRFLLRWWVSLAPGYVPLALALWVGRPVWTWVNGPEYDAAYDYFAVMTLGAWAYLLFTPAVNMLIARLRFAWIAASAGVSLVAMGLIGPWLVTTYGGLGAAMLSAVGVPLIPLVMTILAWASGDVAPPLATEELAPVSELDA